MRQIKKSQESNFRLIMSKIYTFLRFKIMKLYTFLNLLKQKEKQVTGTIQSIISFQIFSHKKQVMVLF